MCKSVPQIEAVRTRTSTSAAPIEGTDAVSKESPRAACILRKAFIVDGMESGSWWDAIRNRSTPPACRALRGLRGRDAAPLRPGLARSQARTSPLYRSRRHSFHAFDNADLLKRLQILQQYLHRHRPVLRRNRIANSLRIAFPIREIQHFVRVLFSAAPEPLVAQQLWSGDTSPFRMLAKIVIAKHRQRTLWTRASLKYGFTIFPFGSNGSPLCCTGRTAPAHVRIK